jgi:hypothetical protein
VIGEPIHVPPDIGSNQLESHRQHIEAILEQVSELAERWAEDGRAPTGENRPQVYRAASRRAA